MEHGGLWALEPGLEGGGGVLDLGPLTLDIEFRAMDFENKRNCSVSGRVRKDFLGARSVLSGIPFLVLCRCIWKIWIARIFEREIVFGHKFITFCS